MVRKLRSEQIVPVGSSTSDVHVGFAGPVDADDDVALVGGFQGGLELVGLRVAFLLAEFFQGGLRRRSGRSCQTSLWLASQPWLRMPTQAHWMPSRSSIFWATFRP